MMVRVVTVRLSADIRTQGWVPSAVLPLASLSYAHTNSSTLETASYAILRSSLGAACSPTDGDETSLDGSHRAARAAVIALHEVETVALLQACVG